MRNWRWRLLSLWIVLMASMPAAEAEDVIVGRADADASGGWPVALWVTDGKRSHFIVRAPRSQLGQLPGKSWRKSASQALMDLERFGAPRLKEYLEGPSCPDVLNWGADLPPSPSSTHWLGERLRLNQPACPTGRCDDPAWHIDLPEGDASALPLRQLLPGLAAQHADWLVLYVVSPTDYPVLSDMPRLRPPDWMDPFTAIPAAAAERFPAISAAFLQHNADLQGLAGVSVLMSSERVGAVQPIKYIRSWAATSEQRRSLGLTAASLQRLRIDRLLVRLVPADRPSHLRLRAAETYEYLEDMVALTSQAVDRESCGRRLSALDCSPACKQQTDRLSRDQRAFDADILQLSPTDRLAACMAACDEQKREGLARRSAETERRQQQAWRNLEKLTGRSAASWMAR